MDGRRKRGKGAGWWRCLYGMASSLLLPPPSSSALLRPARLLCFPAAAPVRGSRRPIISQLEMWPGADGQFGVGWEEQKNKKFRWRRGQSAGAPAGPGLKPSAQAALPLCRSRPPPLPRVLRVGRSPAAAAADPYLMARISRPARYHPCSTCLLLHANEREKGKRMED